MTVRNRRERTTFVSTLDIPADTRDIMDRTLRIMQSLAAASVNVNNLEAISNISRSLTIVEAIVAPFIQSLHMATEQNTEERYPSDPAEQREYISSPF